MSLDYFDLINRDKYGKKLTELIRDKAYDYIVVEESFLSNAHYLKLLTLICCYYEDISTFKLIYRSDNHFDYVMASLVMIHGDEGYKIVCFEGQVDGDIDLSVIPEKRELLALFRNANFRDITSHPLLLPLLYVKLFRDIVTKREEGIINDVLDRDIRDIMSEVGMINVTSMDDYDYFFSNILYYKKNSKPDDYYLKGNKLYYRSRLDLENKINSKKDLLFIPSGRKELARGTFKNYEIVDIEEAMEINNIMYLCDLIKLLKNFYKGKDRDSMIRQIKDKIRNLYLTTFDTGLSLEFYERLLEEGMKIRGWKVNEPYPKSNQLTNYKCYLTENITRMNIRHAYDYHNNTFVYYGDVKNVTNPQKLSKLYIATSIFYMMNKYNLQVEDFSISTMI